MIGIVGAGIAGLTAALACQDAGHAVWVVDKGRGVGGRMATRRHAGGVFDHGAQHLSIRDATFEAFLNSHGGLEVLNVWFSDETTSRWIGNTGMTALPKKLASQLPQVITGERILKIKIEDAQWHIHSENELQWTCDQLILTMPVPQALELFTVSNIQSPALNDLKKVTYYPCFTLMGWAKSDALMLNAEGFIHCEEGAMGWIADQSQKGLAPEVSRVGWTPLVIQSNPKRTDWDVSDEVMIQTLLDEAQPFIGSDFHDPVLHRWRYSLVNDPYPEPYCVVQDSPLLILTGDGFAQGRVESAALSGLAAAQLVLNHVLERTGSC